MLFTKGPSKLERLSLDNLFSIVQSFVWPAVYQRGPERCSTQEGSRTRKQSTKLEKLAKNEHSNLFSPLRPLKVLNVIMLNVIMLSVIMLSVIMLSVIMLSAIMLSVVAPYSEHFIFFITYKWAQQAIVLSGSKPFQPSVM